MDAATSRRSSQATGSASSGATPRRAVLRLHSRIGLLGMLLLALLALKLNTSGLSWGMPAVVSWAPDSIAGTRTLYTLGKWPDRWPGRYPPFHFLVNQLAYWPVLSHWASQGLMVADPANDEIILAPPVAPKVAVLIMLSRVITVMMSVGTVLILALAAEALFGDGLAGLLAGLTVATCAEWVFFSHLGTVDIPHMFWFALSFYVYVRAWRHPAMRHFVMLGVFTALSTSTKDSVAGAYVGIAAVLAVAQVMRARSTGRSATGSLLAFAQPKMLFGLTAFAIPYVIIQGIWTNPEGYLGRLRYFLGGPGITDFNQAYEGPLWLAGEALAESAAALGWPMVVVMAIATVYGLLRWRRQALVVIVPAAAYYLIVPTYTHLVYARILFPVFLCLALLVGGAGADWLRWRRVPVALRVAPVILLFATSIGYCVAVDLEMMHDTRNRAQRWIAENTEPGAPVGVFSHPQYLPYFPPEAGRVAVRLEMAPETFGHEIPIHLLLTSHNYQDFDTMQQECLSDLLAGRFGYTPVAWFTKGYLPPRKRWFSIAGWGTRGAGKVSPDITILLRVGRDQLNPLE